MVAREYAMPSLKKYFGKRALPGRLLNSVMVCDIGTWARGHLCNQSAITKCTMNMLQVLPEASGATRVARGRLITS